MSKKRVLDVGQCNSDHSAICRLLASRFDVEFDRAHGQSDALDLMADGGYDLVLVNRLMDADGSSGLDIIKHIRSIAAFVDVPVMLVSNFADAQSAAEAVGAVPGFGKAQLRDSGIVDLLGRYLS